MTRQELSQLDELLTKLREERIEDLKQDNPELNIDIMDDEDLYFVDYDNLIFSIDAVKVVINKL